MGVRGKRCYAGVVRSSIPPLQKRPVGALPVQAIILKASDFALSDEIDKHLDDVL